MLYKYAYRGWSIVSRCKKELKKAFDHADIINCRNFGKVRIINGGIGFSLLYALVNKDAEVFSYIEDAEDFRIASDTPYTPLQPALPIHAVWNNDFGNEKDFDKTITL